MQKTLLFFLFIIGTLQAQERRIFFGKITDNLGALADVHIINLNTNQATSSTIEGTFKIFAKVTDSLKITFVGYKSKTLVLTQDDFGINEKQILLEKETIKLDEVELKRTTLRGVLGTDIKQTPEDISFIKSKGALDFSNIDFEKKVILPEDEVKDEKYPDMQKVTDPTQQNAGITLSSFSIFTRKKEKRLQQRLYFEEQKSKLPYIIINKIGKHTFTHEFNIPKDKIHHFLDYCGYKDLKALSRKEKIFELIEFLSKKSKVYLKVINQK